MSELGWEPMRRVIDTLGVWSVRRYRLCVVLVLGLAAVNVFFRLGSTAVDSSDEARYGVSAYEMLVRREFIVTTYAGEREYWNLKPPLGYWMIALSYDTLGPNRLALRVPSALCSLCLVALTMAAARRWFNRRASILAGLILATAFPLLSHHGARSGDLDAALVLLLTLMAVQLARVDEAPARVTALGLLGGCGFLLKSFAILPMVALAVGYLLWSDAWRRVRAAHWAIATLAMAAPVVCWAAARWSADGSLAFPIRMIHEDLIDRAMTTLDSGTYGLFAPAEAFIDRFAPWPLVMLVAAAVACRHGRWRLAVPRRWRRPGVRSLLVLWLLLPLVIVSIMKTQHHWYLGPIYPAGAMLAAMAVLHLLRSWRGKRGRAWAFVCLVALPLVVCEARVMVRIVGKDRMPESQRFLLSLAGYRRDMDSTLMVGFSLTPAERFVLEVEDQLDLTEAATAAAIPAGTYVLVSSVPRAGALPPPADASLLVRGEAYAVCRLAR